MGLLVLFKGGFSLCKSTIRQSLSGISHVSSIIINSLGGLAIALILRLDRSIAVQYYCRPFTVVRRCRKTQRVDRSLKTLSEQKTRISGGSLRMEAENYYFSHVLIHIERQNCSPFKFTRSTIT